MNLRALPALSLLPFLALVSACGGGGGGGAACATATPTNRPHLDVTWEVKHGSMDDDPPRAQVKLLLKGALADAVDLGEILGLCKMIEVGTVPEQAPAGLKVTELACAANGKTEFAALVVDTPGKLVLRRYRRAGDGPIEKLTEVKAFEVPSCTQYGVELAQGGGL